MNPLHPRFLLAVSTALALPMVACGSDDSGGSDGAGDATAGDGDGTGGAPRGTTWTDVGPVFEQHCVSCHQEGGVGPFRLDTYDNAQSWAGAAAAVTQVRAMPPFLVKGDGTCGDFQDNHWLTDEELALLVAWDDNDAPEGDGYTVTVPTPPSLEGEVVPHQTPLFTPEIVGGDRAEFDEYRCFMVDMPAGERFLTGHEVVAGTPEIVHHVIGMPVNLDAVTNGGRTNRERIEEMEAAEPGRIGWPCFTGAGNGVEHEGEIISWAPGQGAVVYPEGVGLRIPEGTVMVYQVHYNLVDEAQRGRSDQTTINLKLEDTVDREAYQALPDQFLSGGADREELPPGMPEVDVNWSMPLRYAQGDLEILGTLPHMHERGTSMRYEIAHQDGRTTCLGEVERWDFNWQRQYFYETPITFSRGDQLNVTCTYDTSGDTEPVRPGWGTRNEMCLPILLIAPPV